MRLDWDYFTNNLPTDSTLVSEHANEIFFREYKRPTNIRTRWHSYTGTKLQIAAAIVAKDLPTYEGRESNLPQMMQADTQLFETKEVLLRYLQVQGSSVLC